MGTTPDLTEFEELSRPKRKQCKLRDVLEAVGDEADTLEAAIAATANGRITVGAVIHWCKKRGHDVAQNTIVHHRNHGCSCHD